MAGRGFTLGEAKENFERLVTRCLLLIIPNRTHAKFLVGAIVVGLMTVGVVVGAQKVAITKGDNTARAKLGAVVTQVGGNAKNINITNNVNLPPENVGQAKVADVNKSPCNSTNSFEDDFWDKQSMRVVTRMSDTGEPEFMAAPIISPFQSLMVYRYACPVPIMSRTSMLVASSKSIGLVWEYDNVVQVLIGDGDMRSVRYKYNKDGSRGGSWPYINLGGRGMTDWLPDHDSVTSNTQLDVEVKLWNEGNIFYLQVHLEYYSSKKNRFIPVDFEKVPVEVKSFNSDSGVGKKIRVGITDELFKGAQAKIRFDEFSIKPIE